MYVIGVLVVICVAYLSFGRSSKKAKPTAGTKDFRNH